MMKYLHALLIFTFALLAVACSKSTESNGTIGSNSSPRIKKFSKLSAPGRNAKYILGDSIMFEVSSKKTIDSVQLEYADQKAMFYTPAFTWSARDARTGNQTIRLTVFSGEEADTHYSKVKFLSDVVPELFTYRKIRELPHNEDHFTQGLFFKGDTLIESYGPRGKSGLSKKNLETGEAYRSIGLETKYFAEGSTLWQDQIILLTYTSNIGFVYDANLNVTNNFNYTHEGWGITTFGDTLIVSDGTEVLHLLDPRDFSEFGRLEVYTDNEDVYFLNELEMINGLIYANVYQEDYIVVVDPVTGKVLRKIDMQGLLSGPDTKSVDVLNGIAYHSETDKIYVTGKLWPRLFEVVFVPKN